MADSADAPPALPVLTLLDEATAQGRPALALSRRRAVELLGAEPDDRWWDEHADAWLAAGWRAQVTPTTVTFVPAGPEPVEPVEVRIVVSWPRPDAPMVRVTVDGRETDVSDPEAGEIARLAARIGAAARDETGGGSGI